MADSETPLTTAKMGQFAEHPDALKAAEPTPTYGKQQRWKGARGWSGQMKEMNEMVLGADLASLDSMSKLASTYGNHGRWEEAEEPHKKVIEMNRRLLGTKQLASVNDRFVTVMNQGRWEEAEELGMDVMETRMRMLGSEHLDTLISMDNLALVYSIQGRWERAEALGLRVVEVRRKVLGIEHPLTLSSMASLASTYFNQRRWEETEELEVQVVEVRKRVLGTEHPATIISINNLASTFGIQGRWGKMEELGLQAMATADKKLKAIEQRIRFACAPVPVSALDFDLPWELVDFLQLVLRPDCDLGLVPTITGTPTEAFAATVKDYMNFAWPSVEFDILDLLSKARKTKGRAGKHIFTLHTS